MKQVIEHIEDTYKDDPVVYQWMMMRRRGDVNDEVAVLNLIKALVNNKNLAIRAIDSHRNKGKVVEFKKR